MRNAWKVGLLVVVFVVLLVLGYSFVGESLFKSETERYYVHFENAYGIEEGAVVWLSGVDVGIVDKVELKSPTDVQMTLALKKGTFIPRDAKVLIPTSLFGIGQQQIEIVSEKGVRAGRLPVGGVLSGKKASFVESYLPEATGTFDALNANLEALREILGDKELRKRLESVVASADTTLEELNTLLRETRGVIAENRPAIRNALQDMSQTIREMRQGVLAVNELVSDPELKPKIKGILASLDQSVKKTEELIANVNELVTDPEMQRSLKATIANTESISRSGIEITEKLKEITEDGKDVTEKASALMDDAREVAAEAKKLLEKLQGTVEKLKLPGIGAVPTATIHLETSRNLETENFQTDLHVSYPIRPGSFVYAGVYDATETDRLSLQYGQKFGSTTLRYGIFASKPGLGVDWNPWSNFVLTGDLFDPNDLQFNLRARLFFKGDWYAWFGMNKFFKENEPQIGIGVKR